MSPLSNLAESRARIMIEQLLNVHALASYYRANGNVGHLATARGWLPIIKDTFKALEEDLNEGKEVE